MFALWLLCANILGYHSGLMWREKMSPDLLLERWRTKRGGLGGSHQQILEGVIKKNKKSVYFLCDYTHEYNRKVCQAYGKAFNKCKKPSHFATVYAFNIGVY